ncbi:ATP-binding protein [Candidatus Magnetominusculus dajiuhuensis]|uniref:ATP-binding protein n=1 Tax=Candidatus Magnetominusculus dajiuhuensis TaxID=3137712 RepID=UPI003B42F8DB
MGKLQELSEECGFSKTMYLGSLSDVPILSKEDIKTIVDFLLLFANLIVQFGLSKNKEIELLNESRIKDYFIYKQSRHIAMGELLVNIAHHWRQPLCSIGVIAQDIKDAYLHKELNENYLKKNVSDIMKELVDLSEVINRFSNFYANDAQHIEINISDIINDTLLLIGATFKSKGAVIDKELEEGLIASFCPDEFAQVILNLLTNVNDIFDVRCITNGIVKIKSFRDAITGKIVITIMDNGGGVPEDILGKIFDPYFTTRDKARGRGLGLYITKILVENSMKGTIELRNIDGGCEVRIEI